MKNVTYKNQQRSVMIKFAALFVLMLGFGVFSMAFSGQAEAKTRKACGGLNQKACAVLSKTGPCHPWLTKDRKKICRPCGGLNQQACPVLKKGKPCKDGLEKVKGRCVVNNNRASKEFVQQISAFVGKNTAHVRALSEFQSCMSKNGRKQALRKAIKDKNSKQASKVVNQCLTAKIRKQLSAKPKGLGKGSDAQYFKTLSIGLGGGFIVGIGVSGDAGVLISLTGDGVKFYTNREFSYGLGLSVGADMNVGISRQRLQAGSDEGRAIAASGKYLGGLGVAIDFNGHDFPKWDRFDGFTISGGLGGGAEVGTIYKSTANVY